MLLTTRITEYFINKGIIDNDSADWFQYCLEKRISTVLTSVIFFLIAIKISGFWVAFMYLSSFYFLRVRINGYHANTYIGCLLASIFLEVILLKGVLPLLNKDSTVLLNAISFAAILIWAPFNHPNMHLSDCELHACKIGARIRVFILMLLEIVFAVFSKQQLLWGITLGNTMAALLLAVAIIRKGENTNETCRKKTVESRNPEYDPSRHEKMAS